MAHPKAPGSQTLAELRDETDRRAIVECLALASFMGRCVIRDRYVVPDTIANPIQLSPLGQQVHEALISRRGLRPNELKLAVFMQGGYSDGLMISPATDVAKLREGLSVEILKDRIRFPYVFDRDLHDLAADMFPGKTTLNHDQAWNLLSNLPKGVFQTGTTVVGPFGALESEQYRNIPATRNVPGYLCPDETCTRIHSIRLETAQHSRVSKAVDAVAKYVQRHHSGKADEVGSLVREAAHLTSRESRNKALPSESMFDMTADSFSDGQLRSLLQAVLQSSFREGGRARVRLSRQINRAVTDPQAFVEDMDRASLLQVLLLFDDARVSTAIDRLVLTDVIEVPEHDLHIARVRRHRTQERTQLGLRGVRRLKGGLSNNVLELLYKLYFSDHLLEPADLAYALDVTDKHGADLLTHAVHTHEPRELLETLILPHRLATEHACTYLGITEEARASRADALEAMLWKLGDRIDVRFSELEQMEDLEQSLEKAVSGGEREAQIRGIIANLFVIVESALQKALEFTSWSLTVDHMITQEGFKYAPRLALGHMAFIEAYAPAENPALALAPHGKNTLSPLAAGFGRLSKALRETEVELAQERPLRQWPVASRLEGRPFSLSNVIPFWNLTPGSRDALLTDMQLVNRAFSDASVLRVRNSSVHGNNPFPTTHELTAALNNVAAGREVLALTGFYPQTFVLKQTTGDPSGASERRYVRAEREVLLRSPYWPTAPRLPGEGGQLVIFAGAQLDGCGPLRFQVKASDARSGYWEGWPRRWEVRTAFTESVDDGDGGLPLQMINEET